MRRLCAGTDTPVHVRLGAFACASACAFVRECACLCARVLVCVRAFHRFTAARLAALVCAFMSARACVRVLVCACTCVRVLVCAPACVRVLVCARACVRAGLWAGSRRRGWRRPTATLVCAGLCVRVLVCAFACAQVHGGAAGGGQRQR